MKYNNSHKNSSVQYTQYKTIFECSSDAIIITDSKSAITDLNQAAVEILGYKEKKEVLALKSAFSLFETKEFTKHFQENIDKNGYVTEFETRVKRKYGQAFDATITSNIICLTTEKDFNFVFILRDITKSKIFQNSIENKNSRLAALNDVSATISSTLELNTVLEKTINKILEILGADSVRIYLLNKKKNILELMAAKGMSENFTHLEVMKHRKPGIGLLGQTIISGKAIIIDNFLRSNDPYVNFFIEEGLYSTAYIPLISKGKPVGVLCVSSHFKFEFTQEMVNFLSAIGNQIGLAVDNANLYENIKKAYNDLKEAHDIIIRTEKMASLGKLAATIAHEINNPLASVLNYVKLMKKLVKKGEFIKERSKDISKYLGIMDSETARCGEIVKNLLTFSRKSDIDFKIHQIKEIIDKTLMLMGHAFKMQKIKCIVKIESNNEKIKCDFMQIQHALLNFLYNAAEAMPQGGTITIRVKKSKKKGYVELAISDTGHGISEKDMENIFLPFYTTKEDGKGIGLGLSVVYGIIARHHGTIDVKSELDKGTKFTVILPAA